MDFALIVLGCICSLLATLRAVRLFGERRFSDRALATKFVRIASPPDDRGRLIWMEAARVLELVDSNPDIMVFRLIDEGDPRQGLTVFHGELSVTLREFENTVPWIPMGSRILVHRIGGIDPQHARSIAAGAHGRDVLVMKGLIPAMIEKNIQLAAERWN